MQHTPGGPFPQPAVCLIVHKWLLGPQVVKGLPLPLLKICDFGYSKADFKSAAKSKVRGNVLQHHTTVPYQ